MLVDHGWLRILGSGHPRLPRSLPAWNHTARDNPHSFWLIGGDVIGGRAWPSFMASRPAGT